MKNIEVINLKPIDRYADGSPRYSFHTSFPISGVREINPPFKTKEEAYAEGEDYIRKYEQADHPTATWAKCSA